ncbi:hypothetical protein [Streptomyces sp. NPDC018031]|uniref:hypothetical protein n=1 Tax=Streptomyces sp. NPDC018031 TaxID=3365033 RepID=UPI00379A433D
MPPAYGLVLYARSRALLRTTAMLFAAAGLVAACGRLPVFHLDPAERIPAQAMAPVFAACALGTSLYQHSPALDGTAARPWPARRLGHLAALTLIAGLSLALVAPASAEGFGTAALLRNLIGAVGVALASAAVVGARLSWAPTFVYLSTLYVSGGTPGRAAALWSWAAQPAAQTLAWIPALSSFAVGTSLYVVRGARPENRKG